MSINYSTRVSNLEFASSNLFIKLIYNERILTRFLLSLSDLVPPHIVQRNFVILQ